MDQGQAQTNRKRDPEQTDADIGKGCGQHRATTTTENQPEGADKFGK